MLQDMDEKAFIMQLSLKEAYEVFTMNTKNDTKKYKMIRFGINEVFDIYDYFSNNYIVKTKKALIRIGNKTMKMKDFHTEIEERTKQIKNHLLSEIKDGMDLFNPTGMEGQI